MSKLFAVSVLSGALSVIRILSGFIVVKVVAIYTGPAGIATLGQLQNALGLINGVVSAPGGSGVVRYTAEKCGGGGDACSPWWRAAMQWFALLSCPIAFIVILYSLELSLWLFSDEKYRWLIVSSACALPLTALGSFLSSVLNGFQDYKVFTFLGAGSILVGALFTVIFTIFYGVEGALFAAVIAPVMTALIYLLGTSSRSWFRISYFWGRTNVRAFQDIGGYFLMAATSALVIPGSLLLVRNLIIETVGLDAAGHWQAVYKISEVYIGLITLALTTYCLPRFAILDKDEIYREIRKLTCLLMPLLLMAMLTIFLLRSVVIEALFSREFIQAEGLLGIQLCADFMKILSWMYAYPMISRGATKVFIASEIFFSVSFVVLANFFVQEFGVAGAPLASAVNYTAYFFFVFLLLPRLIRWS